MERRPDDTFSSRIGDVVEGYAALASSLMDRWGAHSTNMAGKVSGDYNAADAAEDLAICATLATEGSLQLAAEAVDALVTLSGVGFSRGPAASQTFNAPAGAALTLTEPLIKGPGLASIPASAVTIEPAQLAAADTEFKVSVDPTGRRGGTYYGKATATTAAGSKDVWVWVTVP